MTVLEKDLNVTDSSKHQSTELALSLLRRDTWKRAAGEAPSASTNTLLLVLEAQGSEQKQKQDEWHRVRSQDGEG